MAARAADLAATYGVLKLKLGTDRDREILAAVRAAAPEAKIRVDANEGWDEERALDLAPVLADHGVEFVEQPVPAADAEGLRRVGADLGLPVAADESCVTASDVPRVAEWADVAVVKLTKCGGLRPTLRAIHAAKAHGLEVLLGCMAESNASIAAAAHLSPLVEHVDLDGSLLLAADPIDGVPLRDGRFDLAGCERPGTGARQA
jgi:L-alanine-DL-glutamate epimerase-like enolase superfamily enzyme